MQSPETVGALLQAGADTDARTVEADDPFDMVSGSTGLTGAADATLTRTMARDLGEHRIRINTVVPGWIMTERQKELWATPEALKEHLKRQILPDLIDPVYVSRMVVFLASDDAAMCTANNYMVEGGSI